MIVAVWLQRLDRKYIYCLVPMILIGTVTVFAMMGNLINYYANFQELWLLAIVGSVILVLDIWVILEGIRALTQRRDEV